MRRATSTSGDPARVLAAVMPLGVGAASDALERQRRRCTNTPAIWPQSQMPALVSRAIAECDAGVFKIRRPMHDDRFLEPSERSDALAAARVPTAPHRMIAARPTARRRRRP